MGNRGITLVELIVVVAIIGTLMTIATLQFNRYTRKAAVEAQVREMYADLMQARSQALFQKRARSVRITTTGFAIYSTTDTSVSPAQQRTLKVPVTPASFTIDFETNGMTNNNGSICIQQADNPGAIDSIVVATTRIQMGKRKTGGACVSADIDTK